MQYLAFLGYIVAVVYAFSYHGLLVGLINILIPVTLIWDLSNLVGNSL